MLPLKISPKLRTEKNLASPPYLLTLPPLDVNSNSPSSDVITSTTLLFEFIVPPKSKSPAIMPALSNKHLTASAKLSFSDKVSNCSFMVGEVISREPGVAIPQRLASLTFISILSPNKATSASSVSQLNPLYSKLSDFIKTLLFKDVRPLFASLSLVNSSSFTLSFSLSALESDHSNDSATTFILRSSSLVILSVLELLGLLSIGDVEPGIFCTTKFESVIEMGLLKVRYSGTLK